MITRRFAAGLRRQDWTAVAVELLVVILGVFIGLQVDNWNDARRARADERTTLQRLLIDADANLVELRRARDQDRVAAGKILSISQALSDSKRSVDRDALDQMLCRWYVHPAIHLNRATYSELVSSGRLLLIRDDRLRAQLASEDAMHLEVRRLDVLIPAVQRGAEPIASYMHWYIDTTRGPDGTGCRFDLDGLRGDRHVGSALAQLYRYWGIYAEFREREISAVETTRAILMSALGTAAGDEASRP